jgi:hypothetical protein
MSSRIRLFFVLVASLAGFGFDQGGCDCHPTPTPTPCSPACATGYTCQSGMCVGACIASQCPSGICATPGQCAECATDAQCSGTKPRCSNNHCVACVPGASDNCGHGAYCDAATNTCTRGCKVASECASGTCEASHDCASCVNDNECALGKVCNNGTCEAPCTTNSKCGAGRECCGSKCQSAFSDNGCHACNVTCSAGQLCGDSGCVPLSVGQLCALDSVSLVHDGDGRDDEAADRVGTALTTGCGHTVSVASVAQTDATVLDQTSGEMKAAPGKLDVFIGGSFASLGVRYLVDSPGLSQVYDNTADDGTSIAIRRRSDGAQLLVIDPATINAGHDYFIVEILKDPTTKATALVGYGMGAPGTYAAAWYIGNRVLSMQPSFMGSYYVVEWHDQNGNNDPDAADSYGVHLND